MALTKDKLITRLQTQVGLDKQESRQIVERLLGIMKETLAKGDDLLISGFGKFSVRQKKARRGRNPQTKEAFTLRPRKVLVFKASGVLRERMNKIYAPFPEEYPATPQVYRSHKPLLFKNHNVSVCNAYRIFSQ